MKFSEFHRFIREAENGDM